MMLIEKSCILGKTIAVCNENQYRIKLFVYSKHHTAAAFHRWQYKVWHAL